MSPTIKRELKGMGPSETVTNWNENGLPPNASSTLLCFLYCSQNHCILQSKSLPRKRQRRTVTSMPTINPPNKCIRVLEKTYGNQQHYGQHGGPKSIQDKDTLMFLVKHLFGQAHAQRKWRSTKCIQGIFHVLTMLDKAFVLLLVEECWVAIQEEIKVYDDKDDGKQGVCARGKYTNHGTADMRYKEDLQPKASKGSMVCMTWWSTTAMSHGPTRLRKEWTRNSSIGNIWPQMLPNCARRSDESAKMDRRWDRK